MTSHFEYKTQYFTEEGKSNLETTVATAFQAAVDHAIEKIVIFTGAGIGVKYAIEKFANRAEYAGIQIIAVTFPHRSKSLPSEEINGISPETAQFIQDNGVPIVRAHLPFDPIESQYGRGNLGQDLSLIGNALSIFCGSMGLCVQAALMACDAGHVDVGEHVISLTSDTAILVRTASTSRLLTDFIVREILCKPVLLNLVKGEVPKVPDEDLGSSEGDLALPMEQAKTLPSPITPAEDPS